MKSKIIIIIAAVGFLTIGCGTNIGSSGVDTAGSSDTIHEIEDEETKTDYSIGDSTEDKDSIEVLRDDNEEGVNQMDEIIKIISGSWSTEDESLKIEIRHDEKGFWAFNYITEKDGEQAFGINDVIKAGEGDVPGTFRDCDYVLEVGSGEFYSYKGIKIKDDETIVLKERERKEYTLNRQD